MRDLFNASAAILAATLALAAGSAAAGDAAAPSVKIVSPAAGATVILGDDANRSVNIELALTNFTFKRLGTCGEDKNCGHAHLWIDPPANLFTDLTIPEIGKPAAGHVCDNPAFPANNQNAGTASNVLPAHFVHCKVPTGKHKIFIGLGGDNHLPIAVNGKPVYTMIEITTVAPKEKTAQN
jgi:hypothetical protein